MARASKRTPKIDPAAKLAMEIGTPAIQVANDQFKVVDIANRTDADQRHMVRSGEKKTVRRMTHLEKLHQRKAISLRQLRICEWFADQRELGYSTLGITANYCGAGGGGFGAGDLFARYKAQNEARSNYTLARTSIELRLLPLFERIVIANWQLSKNDAAAFETACQQLETAIGHMMSFE